MALLQSNQKRSWWHKWEVEFKLCKFVLLYCLPGTVTADNISKYQYVSVRPKAILYTQTDVVKNLAGVVAHQPWVGVLPTVSASLSSHLRSSSHVLDGLRSTLRCLALHGRREHHGRRWRRPGQRRRYGRTTHHLHPLTNYQHSIRILKYTQTLFCEGNATTQACHIQAKII